MNVDFIPSDWVIIAMFMKLITDGAPYTTVLFIAKWSHFEC